MDTVPGQRVASPPMKKKVDAEEMKESSPGSMDLRNLVQGGDASFVIRRLTVRAARRGRRIRPRYRDPI